MNDTGQTRTATSEQLHAALIYCIDFSRTILEAHGEFHPFGAMVDSAGQVVAAAASTGEEHPNSQDLYKLLVEGLRDEIVKGRAIAIAVAVNVTIPEEYSPNHNDGVRVTLESAGHSRNVYVPYQMVSRGIFRKRQTAEFAEPFSVELKPAV